MPVLPKTSFYYKGKRFDVRVTSIKNGYEVRAYDINGKPANGYRYTLDTTGLVDFPWDSGAEACSKLVNAAKSDVESGIWERVLAARARK